MFPYGSLFRRPVAPSASCASRTERKHRGRIKSFAQVPGVCPIQLHSPQASMGKPSPHGALGIAGAAAPAPPLELPPPEPPPPEPPLDAEPLVPLPVVVLVDAPVSLQYVGS